jgi:type II secretory pathway component GspD/PulD (secretin)
MFRNRCRLTLAVLLIGAGTAQPQTLCRHEQVGEALAGLRQLQAEEALQFELRIKVLEAQPQGRPAVLSSPTIVTSRGQPALVAIGTSVPFPDGLVDKPQGWNISPARFAPVPSVDVGQTIKVVLGKLSGGRVRLDLTIERTEVEPGATDGLDVAGTCHRFLRAVELGKSVELPLQCDEQGGLRRWVEVTVLDPVP